MKIEKIINGIKNSSSAIIGFPIGLSLVDIIISNSAIVNKGGPSLKYFIDIVAGGTLGYSLMRLIRIVEDFKNINKGFILMSKKINESKYKNKLYKIFNGRFDSFFDDSHFDGGYGPE